LKKIFKKIFKVKYLLLLVLLFVITANFIISKNTHNSTYNDRDKIPHNKVGLVLGTGQYLVDGRPNLYFIYRVNATVELFQKGKIDFILISGDNSKKDYNEPEAFKTELIRKGIPKEKIFLDFAGFRTLDSVIRAKKVFGLTAVTIISQQFHNERAIYIAKHNGISAIGYNAKDVGGRFGLKVKLREYLARTKMFLDILFNVKPKYLGKKITIG